MQGEKEKKLCLTIYIIFLIKYH